MELSLGFIADKLMQHYQLTVLDLPRNMPRFSKIRVFETESYENASVKPLVIASSTNTDVADLAKCKGLIWLGEPEPPAGVPTIWISNNTDTLEVLGTTLDIMEAHERWLDQVHNALLENKPLEDVAKMLSMVTDNPFWCADTALRVLYMSDDNRVFELSDIWKYQAEHGRYSTQTLSSLMSSGDLERINSHYDAWLFADSTTFEGPFISKAISSRGSIYGYVFIIPIDESSLKCDIELLEAFGNLIARYMRHSRGATPASMRLADQMLEECLSSPQFNEADLEDLAHLLEWDANGTFAVSVFQPLPQSHSASLESNGLAESQIHLLEDNAPGRVIQMGENAVLISDLTKFSRAEFTKMLGPICRKLNWRVGTSAQFNGLAGLRPHYNQALIALRLGSTVNPSYSVYAFSDYLITYICEQLETTLPEPLVLHQDVKRIMQADQENNGSLLETLEAFLENERSIAKTAQQLYLHRNSVAYRIDKIRSLMKTDLDDDDNRLSIMLSLRIVHRRA